MRGSYNNPIVITIRPAEYAHLNKVLLSLGWLRGRGAWYKGDVWVKDSWVTK